MPPKKGGKKGKKKGPPPPELDPDEPFRRYVEETRYISKPHLQSITDAYLDHIDMAIRAFTVAALPLDAEENLDEREQRICRETAKRIPLSLVPGVVRALGFNPTDHQIKQLEWLVWSTEPYVTKGPPASLLGRSLPSRASHSGEGPVPEASTNEEDSWIVPECSVSSRLSAFRSIREEVPAADRSKLEAVLLDILHTGLLVYDPSKVSNAEGINMCPMRSVTVLERNNTEMMEAVFDVLWNTSGQATSADGERIIRSHDLSQYLRNASSVLDFLDSPLDANEVKDFIFTVEDSGMDTIREDTFMTTEED